MITHWHRKLAAAVMGGVLAVAAAGARADEGRGECEEALELPVVEFLGRSASCAADTPVGGARFALEVLDVRFPNVLPALNASGLKLSVSHRPPALCTIFTLEGERTVHEVEVPQHGDAGGLYCAKQRHAWADGGFPAAILSEVFHAADQLALEQSRFRPNWLHRLVLMIRYGKDAMTYYGFSKTSVDDRFLRLWRAYRKNGPSLGSQGYDEPIELFMEAGDSIFATRRMGAIRADYDLSPADYLDHPAVTLRYARDGNPAVKAYFTKTLRSLTGGEALVASAAQ